MSRRRLALAAATVLGVAATGVMPATAGSTNSTDSDAPVHRVVADGLDNPRQLNWTMTANTLVVAEAGRGAVSPQACNSSPCVGPTGAVGIVKAPWRPSARYERVIEGLPSNAGGAGTFAGGHTGVDGVGPGAASGEFVSAFDYDFEATPPSGLRYLADAGKRGKAPAQGQVLPGGDRAVLLADLLDAEEDQNPGGVQIESNPYAVIFVAKAPGRWAQDGYALVADAAGNVVWKVAVRKKGAPRSCAGGFTSATFDPAVCAEVSVFHRWDDTGLGDDRPDGAPPEFVPTSLALDKRGNVWVGGLGASAPGAGSVVKLSPDGRFLQQWDGFTGVTGIAVTDDALYVSQLRTSLPGTSGAPGSVVKAPLDDADAGRVAVAVPWPAGLAADPQGNVYAAVNSVAPAEGMTGTGTDGGAVWQLDFSGARPTG